MKNEFDFTDTLVPAPAPKKKGRLVAGKRFPRGAWIGAAIATVAMFSLACMLFMAVGVRAALVTWNNKAANDKAAKIQQEPKQLIPQIAPIAPDLNDGWRKVPIELDPQNGWRRVPIEIEPQNGWRRVPNDYRPY